MEITRRELIKGFGALGTTAIISGTSAPAIAQNKPIKIGILSPHSGVIALVGQQGRRAAKWAEERINAEGGIAGRPVKLIFAEAGSPRETIERFRQLVLVEEVDCVQGLASTGTTNTVAPVAEQERKLLMTWDGTTQNGVHETMFNPRYVFKSTNNECDAVMAGLLTVEHFKDKFETGEFKTIGGINPDYSYGRNCWTAFKAILDRYEVDYESVSEQWVPVGSTNLTSQVAALSAANPDLIFGSVLFAGLPIFLRQAYAAGLLEDTQLVLPGAGWQINQIEKAILPEGTLFGHDSMYFAYPQASKLQQTFVNEFIDRYGLVPHWETDRAYFPLAAYKAAVEAAHEAVGRWPNQEEIIDAMEEIEVESLGGPSRYRWDNVAEQSFYQGLSTNDNEYAVPTLSSVTKFLSKDIQMPPKADFWEWAKTAQFPI